MIIALINLFCLYLNAQTRQMPTLSDVQILTQQGSLFSIQVVKGEPIKIYVVGEDMDDLYLKVRRVNGLSSKILEPKRVENYYVVPNAPKDSEDYELEITPQVKTKKEVFKVKIDNKLK